MTISNGGAQSGQKFRKAQQSFHTGDDISFFGNYTTGTSNAYTLTTATAGIN